MGSRREVLAFCVILAGSVSAFFHETLFGGKVLSPVDVLRISASFREEGAGEYEPANRLLMDPVLQFQPWLEFNRRMLRSGRLPLWNAHVGCGAPQLANGQSAVFDPFHLLAYLGPTPQAYAWMAAARLWTAGLGMFLLARSWGLGFWGRWFAGLAFPFCGFVVLWLLYPVTPVAIWMPWLFLSIKRLIGAPTPSGVGWLAIAVALVIFGGHIQTAAHVLLAGAVYALAAICWERREAGVARRAVVYCALGTCLGLCLSAVQILPLGSYLAKSSVWSDRQREQPAWWVIERPRVLDAACTAVPYLYGSQRRGHPNLARALGVHNLNESAAGYAGLATLVWLAPLAVVARGRAPQVRFLCGLAIFGAMGAFRFPPVANLLRALPVIDVIDNRRLTLWLAFGLTLLGGIGLDHVAETRSLARGWINAWIVGAIILVSLACVIPFLERPFRERADAHYHAAALASPGANLTAYQERAVRQVRQVIQFVPRYHALVGIELMALAALAINLRRTGRCRWWMQPALIGLTALDAAVLGLNVNPAIRPEIHAYEPPVIARLREKLPPGGRAIGLGEELPPNVLMRFGLADARNYDSVELASSLAWFAPLYEPARSARSSRSDIRWRGVIAARDRLVESCVGAIVASTRPPAEAPFECVERVGSAWIAWQTAKPWADSTASGTRLDVFHEDGRARILIDARLSDRLTVRETWDPGWRAQLDGKPVEIQRKSPVFLSIEIPSGQHTLVLSYDPGEVRLGLAVSSCALVLVILVLTGNRLFWIPGITMAKGLDGAKPPG